MAEPTNKSPPAAGGGGLSRHIAHETTQWRVVCTEPDYCRVGKSVIPFDSYALIGNKQLASPNVKAQGTPVYRINDLHKGVLADAGSHIVAGTSLGSGHVKFLDGQNNVKANNIPVARKDNKCLINCNAAGVGGAMGKVVTDLKMRFSVTEEDFRRDLENYTELRKYFAEEADKLTEKIDQAKQQLGDTTPLWDWTERGQIKDRIAQLEAQRSYYDTSVEYYGREIARVTDVLYPDTPVMSAVPSGGIEASLRRIQEKRDLAIRRLNASIDGGPIGAAAVMAGADPGVAVAVGELAMLGRGGKAPVARGKGGATPKPGGGTGEATGPGVFVKAGQRIKSLREQYLGRTPGKNSRTGKEVQDRMRKDETLRDGRNGPEFKASNGKWYPLKDADMAHKTDAVTWWNETGRQYGAKAPEVRSWMLKSDNYVLDHYSLNRSAGAKLGETYLPPLK